MVQASQTNPNPPISQALKFQGPADFLKEAKQTALRIDSIHLDGAVPATTVRPTTIAEENQKQGLRGFWDPNNDLIAIRATNPNYHTTLIHELGHLIDYRGFGQGTSAAATLPEFQTWRDAVENSMPIRYLNSFVLGETRDFVHDGVAYQVPINQKTFDFIQYLLQWDEIWARSYTQFIAESIGKDLQTQISSIMATKSGQFSQEFWNPYEFMMDISDTIHDVLEQKGWLL